MIDDTHILNSSEAVDSIVIGVVADFEKCDEPGWETTPKRAIRLIVTCVNPNTIVPTGVVAE